MKIVADVDIPLIKEYFQNFGTLHLVPGRNITQQDVEDADALIVRSITKVTSELLQNSAVKFVGSITSGKDHVDTQFLQKANIHFCATQGFNAQPVAEYVVAVIAALQKQKILAKNLTAAVIGVGASGHLVVERLKLLNFNVITCDPWRGKNEQDFLSTSIDAIENVDLVTLHVPLEKNPPYPTYHFINKEFLKRQNAGCVLINASRGEVINQADLLHYGKHIIPCLDVWENEPSINAELMQQAQIATPHIAGYSRQAKERGTAIMQQKFINTMLQKTNTAANTLHDKNYKFTIDSVTNWQDAVLQVFNPMLQTATMRGQMSAAKMNAFDTLRKQFKRNEFSVCKIINHNLKTQDKTILTQLGFELS